MRCYHFFGDGKTRLPFYRRRGLKKKTPEFFFFIFSVDIFHLLEYTALSSGRRHRDRFFPSPKAIWIAPAATQSVTPTLLSSFHFLLAARTHTSARLETRDTGDTAVVGSFFFFPCFVFVADTAPERSIPTGARPRILQLKPSACTPALTRRGRDCSLPESEPQRGPGAGQVHQDLFLT